MIAPSKYLDLNSSVLRLSAALLSMLRENSVLPLPEVEHFFASIAGERGRRNLGPTLSFLYLIKQIDFLPKADAIVRRKQITKTDSHDTPPALLKQK